MKTEPTVHNPCRFGHLPLETLVQHEHNINYQAAEGFSGLGQGNRILQFAGFPLANPV
jgi:hypothetical protein